MPGLPRGLTVEDLCDWDKMCAIIADSELWWEPGAKIGYHAITWGYIIGEIVRRATGKPISEALRDEVARPLGIGLAVLMLPTLLIVIDLTVLLASRASDAALPRWPAPDCQLLACGRDV